MSPLIAAQVLLSLTLLASGLAKLGDRDAIEDAMRSLRLPARALHPLAAAALPGAEIALAILAWVPVVALQVVVGGLALALVVAYLVIIARALGFAETVTCSCFGTLASPTVSQTTLARNIVLVVLAGIALGSALAGVTARAVLESPGALAAWSAAIAAGVLLTALTLGATRDRAAGAPSDAGGVRAELGPDAGDDDEEELDYLRTPTPHAIVRHRDGGLQSLHALTAGRAVLLVWVSPGCGPCERVLDRLASWRRDLAPLVDVRAVLHLDVTTLDEAVLTRVGEDPIQDLHGTLAGALAAHGSPSAVLLGADGMLAGGPVAGAGHVTELVEEIIAQLAETHELATLTERAPTDPDVRGD